eukprot:1145668-Pelagomonas_calceolata.AAC.8
MDGWMDGWNDLGGVARRVLSLLGMKAAVLLFSSTLYRTRSQMQPYNNITTRCNNHQLCPSRFGRICGIADPE